VGIKMRARSVARCTLHAVVLVVFISSQALALNPQPAQPPAPEKVSLDLRGVDILALFKILSQKMGLTILPGKGVSGRLNVFLNNVSYEDALDLIILSQDLACEREGSVINVLTSADYEKIYGRKYNERRRFRAVKLNYAKPSAVFTALGQLESDVGKIILDETSATIFLLDIPERVEMMLAAIQELDQPPLTKVFQLQYAKPEDIKAEIAAMITPGVGEVVVDAHSSKIIVSDLPQKMAKITRLVREFDTETPQVLIESRVVEVTLKDEFQSQVNWDAILHKVASALELTGTFPIASSWTPSPALSADNQLLSIGSLTRDDYNVALKILQTYGDVKVISQPEILAVNNQEAKIMVGSREAYVLQTLSQAQSTTVSAEDIQFIDVGVKLNVIPTINPDGFITMKIKPEVSSVRDTITTTLGSRVPIVDTSSVESVVKVKDGAMMLIGGLSKRERRKDTSGVPLLVRAPFLGAFFSTRAQLDKTTEFFVFLTPHIVRGDTNVNLAQVKKDASPELLPELSKLTSQPVVTRPPKLGVDVQDKLKGMKAVEIR